MWQASLTAHVWLFDQVTLTSVTDGILIIVLSEIPLPSSSLDKLCRRHTQRVEQQGKNSCQAYQRNHKQAAQTN